MRPSRGFVLGPVLQYLQRLRFPWLFAVTATVFLLDLMVPDIVPFADEILLGLLATLLGVLRRRRGVGSDVQEPGKPADPPPPGSI